MSADAKKTGTALDCGGKRSATPLSPAPMPSEKAVSPQRSATAVPDADWLKRVAIVAAVFCLLVSCYLVYQHALAAERDPWKSPQLLALKEKLRTTPTDAAVKTEIRRLDLEFRQRYQRRLALDRTGGWLLVGGIAILLLAAKQLAKLQARPWLPKLRADSASEGRIFSAQARLAVMTVGAVTGVSLLTLALSATSPLPRSAGELDRLLGKDAASEAARNPTVVEFQINWPQFRGFSGSGVASAKPPFDATTTTVIWKTPIPAPGFNSPVAWSNRLFLSGGTASKREVFCYEATDGKLLWQRTVENVPGAPAQFPELPEMTGYAAPTMATDGQHAFVLFPNGDLAAFKFDGSLAWSKNIGVPKNMYGHASSLAIAPGKLIVQLDQDEAAPGGSKLLAFDCGTGRQLWERRKPTHGSWASPIIGEAAGKSQIITLALPFVMSHALDDGRELWRAELMSGEVAPSPIFAGGLAIVVVPSGELIAIRPDGAGDVTKSHVAWTATDNVPDITSPVSNGELVFAVTTMGGLGGFEVATGKLIWQKELEFEVQASPVIAGGQLILLGTKGELVAVHVGREFKELSRTKLEDAFHASPAFLEGRMILRGATNLWSLGSRKEVAHAR
jgi:outer membrane protein assembly factor BamB